MSSKAEQAEQVITLVVQTTRGSDSFTLAKTAKVEDLIDQVRERFELTGEGTFTLVRKSDNEALTPTERTLVSFGLEQGDELILTGGGQNV